jgi:hypothetical protein
MSAVSRPEPLSTHGLWVVNDYSLLELNGNLL